MDERAALALVAGEVAGAGDDAAVLDSVVLTTDMLHDRTDFPAGTTRYTAGWRSVGASLSDLAGMGARARGAVAVYAAPAFEEGELTDFLRGAREVCRSVDAEYVGGDLDEHREFTVATTALGETDDPVRRSGATPGEAVCVTGHLGRSAAALELFERGDLERANDLFQFQPRVAAGREIAGEATAMMDVSDGLARSLHQLAAASSCGFDVSWESVPVDPAVHSVTDPGDEELLRERSVFFGEDFELLCTVPSDRVDAVRDALDVEVSVLGEAVARRDPPVRMDGEPLPDRGFTHGTD